MYFFGKRKHIKFGGVTMSITSKEPLHSILGNLEPAKVFQYFEEICNIPHASRNTKELCEYCATFALEHNLRYVVDDSNNIIIFKNASKGYESHDAVIIQGHLDMVPVKTAESTHNFEKDGLSLIIEDDEIRCKDTSLGGDDGIAIAFALAILDDMTIDHPPIEAVFTADEEIGLLGASALDVTELQGKCMINLDSEEEGVFLAGCAGGVTANITFPINRINITGVAYQLTIQGLLGGHSGTEIDKGYANAHKILGRILYSFKSNGVYFGIHHIAGGDRDNVIPSLCNAVFVMPDDDENKELAMKHIAELNNALSIEYQIADPDILITLEHIHNKEEDNEFSIMSRKSSEILTFFLANSPNGIQYMNQSIKGLVETSLNMGILNTTDASVNIGYSVRSSVKSSKHALMDQLIYLTEFLGGECFFEGDYPSWAFVENSRIRTIFLETFKELYEKEATVETIHAGLECGIFADKFETQGKTLDIIAFGPNLWDIHSVKERLSISSVQRVWGFLLAVLKKL